VSAVPEFRGFLTLEKFKQSKKQTEYTNCIIKVKQIQSHTNKALWESQKIQGIPEIQGYPAIQGIQEI
jgi:hypothetical protein